MNISVLPAALTMAIAVSGCSSWPEQGRGGFAEHHLQSLQEQSHRDVDYGLRDRLRAEHDLLARHLDVLVLEGGELCFPATVQQARQRQHRIARSIAGGLAGDSYTDMVLQRELLTRLERQLDHVKSHEICTLPFSMPQTTPGEVAAKIDELLNADNQFAFDSSELNPKYLGRLSEAATLLNDYPQYRLNITGHTDSIGNNEHNQRLSLQRAKKVSRYLQVFGLAADRISVSAVGSKQPLLSGSQPEIRLTNRRVTIDLVEMEASGTANIGAK